MIYIIKREMDPRSCVLADTLPDQMPTQHRPCAFVVDRDGHCEGIVSSAEWRKWKESGNDALTIGEIANRAPIYAYMNTSIEDVRRMFVENAHIRWIPVLDEKNRPVWIYCKQEYSLSEAAAFYGSKAAWALTGGYEGEDYNKPFYGTPVAEWAISLYPRLCGWLPARSVLEIAPGTGRWAQFLIPLTERYVGIDFSGFAIETCKARFVDCKNAEFYVNDGKHFDTVEDGTFDLIVTYDSLYDAEMAILSSYLDECLRVLTSQGIAMIHHSDMGDRLRGVTDSHPGVIGGRICDTTAEAVYDYIVRQGGHPLLQERFVHECIPGDRDKISDCITVFSKSSVEGHVFRCFENWNMKTAMRTMREHVGLYTSMGQYQEKVVIE